MPTGTALTATPAAHTKQIRVKEKHIQQAVKRDSRHCMIADAIKAQIPDAKYILVDVQSIRWSDLKKGERYQYFTPTQAQQAILKFDQGKPVEPFTFQLIRGIVHPVGWQAQHPSLTREKKQKQNRKYRKRKAAGLTGKRRTPTQEREYGMRKLEA